MAEVSYDELVTAALSGNQVVSFPTDTVPALAVRPDHAQLLFELKQRSADKPLILMGATSADLWPFTQGRETDYQAWKKIAAQYWPGALTLVLPATAQVPLAMHPHDPTTIGLRVPDCQIARQILQRTGPLATTSANLSNQPPLTSLSAIARQFPTVLTLRSEGLEPDQSISEIPSTVIKWQADSGWEILRQGGVKLQFKE